MFFDNIVYDKVPSFYFKTFRVFILDFRMCSHRIVGECSLILMGTFVIVRVYWICESYLELLDVFGFFVSRKVN